MKRSARAWFVAPLAALTGLTVLAGATRPPKRAALPQAPVPPPKTAPAPPKAGPAAHQAAPRASAEPTEAQLPPVDPAWRRNGWHAVVPHAYVIRALVPARLRPEASARAVFWLKGGTRVPILEQRSRWWRVGWTHGRSGWIPATDLQPHATFVFIDVKTGRVLRRLAARGQAGAVSDGRCLWSFSDTGITRTSLTDPPAFWSNPIHASQDDSLPRESVWTPERSAFFMWQNSNDTGALVEVFTRAGAIRRVGYPDSRLGLVRVDAQKRLLLTGSSFAELYDSAVGRRLKRAPGGVYATAGDGAIYAQAFGPGGAPKLIRYDANLKPIARIKGVADVYSGCVSPDGDVLALCDQQDSRIELRRADTLFHMMTLHPNPHDYGTLHSNPHDYGPFVRGVVGNSGGWWTVGGGEPGNVTLIVHYTPQGERLRTWESNGPWVMSRSGRAIFTAGESDLLAIDTERGTARRIPYSWRRPLPRRYLPKPSDPDTPTHLDLSDITLTPDGRTLIITEWLNGDPEG